MIFACSCSRCSQSGLWAAASTCMKSAWTTSSRSTIDIDLGLGPGSLDNIAKQIDESIDVLRNIKGDHDVQSWRAYFIFSVDITSQLCCRVSEIRTQILRR